MTIQTSFQASRTTNEPLAQTSTNARDKFQAKNNDFNFSSDEPLNVSLKNSFSTNSPLGENASSSTSNRNLANSLSNLNLSVSEIEPVTEQGNWSSKARMVVDSEAPLMKKTLLAPKNSLSASKNSTTKKESHRRHHSHGHFLKTSSLNAEVAPAIKPNQVKSQEIIRPIRSSSRVSHKEKFESIPFLQAFYTFLSYSILHIFGHLREFLRRIGLDKRQGAVDNNTSDFVPLYQSFESFFTRNYYLRVRDTYNRPICSVPGAEIELLERKSDDYNWTYYFTGKKVKAINMGSYNYLGFAENDGPCSRDAIKSIRECGVATSSARQELGTLKCQENLENLLAKFLGVESAITFGMGFATNSLNIPALVNKKCLILSDEFNHVSLVLGSRLSGATVKVFKHNDAHDLEAKLKKAIVEGHPVTRRPWKKILIIVEGVYSMEGTMPPLPEIIAIKKKYKAYLYLDEAHSIGAVGPTGRGVVEHFGCNPKDIDVLMGTFTKSFGSAGGYVAGPLKLINYLKHQSHAQCYASSMCPAVCLQITKTLEILMGIDGTDQGAQRIKQLRENTIYFRDKLIKLGYIVYGCKGSPVVPALVCIPSKVVAFNRKMLEHGVAVVTVGFPATVLTGARVRFCISAAHTREMLDKVLEAIDECGDMISVKFSKKNPHLKIKEQ